MIYKEGDVHKEIICYIKLQESLNNNSTHCFNIAFLGQMLLILLLWVTVLKHFCQVWNIT